MYRGNTGKQESWGGLLTSRTLWCILDSVEIEAHEQDLNRPACPLGIFGSASIPRTSRRAGSFGEI